MHNFRMVAFDGDDTLWENEALYRSVRAEFLNSLSHYPLNGDVEQQVHDIEVRNLKYYGYGVSGFIFSLIETGIELTGGKYSGADVLQLLNRAKEMLTGEVRLLENAQETLATLAARVPLILITKGDLRHQRLKIDRSGLRPFFQSLEIVSDKTAATYAEILETHNIPPDRFLMVGNSLRSDILPVLEIGGWAVYVPNELTWDHESAEVEPGCCERMVELKNLSELPAWLDSL